MLLLLKDKAREAILGLLFVVASEEGNSQVRLTESTHTGAKPQTPRICSEMAEELGLSSREDVIRGQSVLRKLQRSLIAHTRELRVTFSSDFSGKG